MTDRVGVLPQNMHDRLVIEFTSMLGGQIRWIPSEEMQRLFRNTRTGEAVQLDIESTLVLQQTIEAMTALAVEPNATSWPQVAQPIFDGVRQLLTDRQFIRETERIG